MDVQIDIRHVLPVIRVPTLFLHSIEDKAIVIEHSRILAQKIAGTRMAHTLKGVPGEWRLFRVDSV